MRKAQRWRYYCDHCDKSGGSGGHMAKHEAACTANPNRVCGFCGQDRPVAELMVILGAGGAAWKSGMAALRLETQNCPGCMLATIRQSSFHFPAADKAEESTSAGVEEAPFDFQAEKEAWWLAHLRAPRPVRRPLTRPGHGEAAETVEALLLALLAPSAKPDHACLKPGP